MIISLGNRISYIATFAVNGLFIHSLLELLKNLEQGQIVFEVIIAIYATLCIATGYLERDKFSKMLGALIASESENTEDDCE